MKNDKELFRKFAKGECTEEEAKTIQDYLDEHPGELEDYFPLDDWLYESKENLDPVSSEKILQHIQSTYVPEKRNSITTVLLRYTVAACLIGMTIFIGIKWFQKPAKTPQESAFITNINTDSVQTLKTLENITNEVIAVGLPDGSQVTMYPRSTLRYLPEYEQNKREVYLTGKALFNVSKDKSRPFTVYADGIATTALGTLFMVAELEGRKVSVALMEGRIKVWPQQSERKDSVLMQPGDKLIVNSKRFKSYRLEKPIKEKKPPVSEEKKDNTDTLVNALVFKNDRLKDVFKKIEEKFDVTIHYEAVPGIAEESFTGTFLENDHLEFICNTICNLHGLQYRKEGNVLTILR